MKKLSLLKVVCIVFVFCAATSIVSPAQTLTTLYNFCPQSGCPDGGTPYAGLIQATDGNFYGTTAGFGAGYGTVYKITSQGALTTLYSFDYTHGAYPYTGLVQGTDGNFYGTTYAGGANSLGTAFKITPGGTLTTVYSFCSQSKCADGAAPLAPLVQATDGNFYGTTVTGGANAEGTVFKITSSGTLTTLHSFCSPPNCADGALPQAGLVQGTDGNLYGTTIAGAPNANCPAGCGTVFKINLGGTLTTLYSFCSQANCPDGDTPVAAVVQGTDGNFYGTTYAGGGSSGCSGGCGTVFKITPSGALTTLYSFAGSDGANPYAGLVQATDGNFYGTAEYAGASGDGEIFKITPSGSFTIVHSFDGTDGCNNYAGLVQATDGNLYGTNYGCGAYGEGTVFKLSVGIVLSPLQFVPVTPCRLVDTRTANGGSGPIQGGNFETFDLPQLAQQNPNCTNISAAAAYSLNVTVVPPAPLGYLTIWPAGRTLPLVSTMNSLDGRVKANAAIVPAGASQAISVFVSNTTDVVLDIDGYFAPVSSSTLAFYPLPPCRVADTRDPSRPQGLGPPSLPAQQERDFPVLEATTCFPQGVTPAAYSFNFTAVPKGALGYLTVWPTGQSQPFVSTLNAPTGTATANAAIVPAGAGGEISAYAFNDTDLVIDVNGYFAPAGPNGLSLYPVVPCRVLDTRPPLGNGSFSGTLTPPVDVVGSPCAVPSQSEAYVFNATVVPVGSLGYLTLWPYGGQQPVVSTLNAYDGAITSNMAIVPAGQNGEVEAFAYGTTNLILDISSYFAP